jgi:hypothetical protein
MRSARTACIGGRRRWFSGPLAILWAPYAKNFPSFCALKKKKIYSPGILKKLKIGISYLVRTSMVNI